MTQYLVSESLMMIWKGIINHKLAFVVNRIVQSIIHLNFKQNNAEKMGYLFQLRGDQYQVVQKCSSMSYISLTPQKIFFDFLPEEVT